MANSKLQGKTYSLPDNVLEFLGSMKGGRMFDKRITDLTSSGTITYEQLKFFKHDLEKSNLDQWKPFLNWVNRVLDSDRKSVENRKETTSDAGMQNRYRDERGVDLNRSTKETLMSETIEKLLKEEILKYKK